ncbi:lactate utilization protein [bacterium]|nr:lactate utilization protein [bacterium]
MSSHFNIHDLKKQMKKSVRERPDGVLPYKKSTKKAIAGRDLRASEWDDFEERRDRATQRRQEAIDTLPDLHDQLRERWEERGIVVHEAKDTNEAQQHILKIIRNVKADRILKSKSMLSEEIEINDFLEKNSITPVETDLGEYIVQLRGEHPSHITMPAMHLLREDVGQLFAEKLGVEYTDDPPTLTKIAREALRKEFLAAQVGMCGVNFAVAESGHLATVTNEGNGRMVTSQARVVIALMGWERVTQSLEDLGELWQLLARSATGQRATVYLNLLSGPSPGPTGPDEVHVVIVDNGRKRIHQDPTMREVLRCIRCGACLNVCPVYRQVGGHPYGGVYPGPIGAVLTPALHGTREAPDHAFASSLCGACEDICPVKIPLPKLLLHQRHQKVEDKKNRGFDAEEVIWSTFAKATESGAVFSSFGRAASVLQKVVPGGSVPMPQWQKGRTAPAFPKQSFRQWYEQNKRETGREKDE